MICKECGAQVVNGSNFCEKCGKKLCDVCNCWVLNRAYNCGYDVCPGEKLLTKEIKKFTEAER